MSNEFQKATRPSLGKIAEQLARDAANYGKGKPPQAPTLSKQAQEVAKSAASGISPRKTRELEKSATGRKVVGTTPMSWKSLPDNQLNVPGSLDTPSLEREMYNYDLKNFGVATLGYQGRVPKGMEAKWKARMQYRGKMQAALTKRLGQQEKMDRQASAPYMPEDLAEATRGMKDPLESRLAMGANPMFAAWSAMTGGKNDNPLAMTEYALKTAPTIGTDSDADLALRALSLPVNDLVGYGRASAGDARTINELPGWAQVAETIGNVIPQLAASYALGGTEAAPNLTKIGQIIANSALFDIPAYATMAKDMGSIDKAAMAMAQSIGKTFDPSATPAERTQGGIVLAGLGLGAYGKLAKPKQVTPPPKVMRVTPLGEQGPRVVTGEMGVMRERSKYRDQAIIDLAPEAKPKATRKPKAEAAPQQKPRPSEGTGTAKPQPKPADVSQPAKAGTEAAANRTVTENVGPKYYESLSDIDLVRKFNLNKSDPDVNREITKRSEGIKGGTTVWVSRANKELDAANANAKLTPKPTLAEMGRKARADKSLDETLIRNDEGKTLTLREHAEDLLSRGYKPEMVEQPKYTSKAWEARLDKLKEEKQRIFRREFNASAEEFHRGKKRVAEIDAEINGRMPRELVPRAVSAGGSRIVLTKAQYDYMTEKVEPISQPKPQRPSQGMGTTKPTTEAPRLVANRVAPEKSQRAQGIEDFGEHIPGSRKETATTRGPASNKKVAKEGHPALRHLQVSEVVSSPNAAEVGKFVINNTKDTDFMGRPRRVGRMQFNTRAEAERAIPVLAVAENHNWTKMGDGSFAVTRRLGKRNVPIKGGFKTMDEVKSYIANHPMEILEYKLPRYSEFDYLESVKREGAQVRKGDIKPNDFQDVFAFRGGQFGKWNLKEYGQASLNHAYDAFHDLAEVTGLAPGDLSLNGDLAIAFGARGHGAMGWSDSVARAHYEPGQRVINLTREKGAGALAHEWAHALDNSFKHGGADFASTSRGIESTGRVGEAWKRLMDEILTRPRAITKEEIQVSRGKGIETRTAEVESRLAGIRQSFAEPGPWSSKKKPATASELAEFDKIADKIKSGDYGDEVIYDSKARYVLRKSYESVIELSNLFKKVRGRSLLNADGTASGNYLASTMYDLRRVKTEMESAADTTVRGPSQFMLDAREADKIRATPYYGLREEMVARAFQAYVKDKLGGRNSQYLNTGGHSESRHASPVGDPIYLFPRGEERTRINQAFDSLFEAIRESKSSASTKSQSVQKMAKTATEAPRMVANSVAPAEGQLRTKSQIASELKQAAKDLVEADLKDFEEGRTNLGGGMRLSDRQKAALTRIAKLSIELGHKTVEDAVAWAKRSLGDAWTEAQEKVLRANWKKYVDEERKTIAGPVPPIQRAQREAAEAPTTQKAPPSNPQKAPAGVEAQVNQAFADNLRDKLGMAPISKQGKRLADIVESPRAQEIAADPVAFSAKWQSEPPRPLRDEEVAGLAGGLSRLIDDLDTMQSRHSKLIEDGNLDAAAMLDMDMDNLRDKIATVTMVVHRTGTQWGLGGIARRLAIQNDYSAGGLTYRLTRGTKRKATPTEVKKAEAHAKSIADAEAEIDRRVQEAIDRRLREMGSAQPRAGRTPKQRIFTEDAYQAAVKRLRAGGVKQSKTRGAAIKISAQDFQDLAVVLGYHIENGVRSLADLRKTASEVFPDADANDVALAAKAAIDEARANRKPPKTKAQTLRTLEAEISDITEPSVLQSAKRLIAEIDAEPGKHDAAFWQSRYNKAVSQLRILNRGKGLGEDILLRGTDAIQDPEVRQARIALDRRKADAEKWLNALEHEAKTNWQKVADAALNILDIPRTLKASLDLSAPGRQGALLIMANPIRARKAFSAQMQAISKRGAENVLDGIQTHKHYDLGMDSKLAIMDVTDSGLFPREEHFVNDWTNKIPGVSHSNRAYSAFLSQLRMDWFSSMIDTLEKNGTPVTRKEAAQIAHFVNVATGRGTLGNLEKAGPTLAKLLFAPKWAMSRIQYAAGQPIWRAGGLKTRTGRLIAAKYAQTLGGYAITATVLSLLGMKIGSDPNESDFGKAILGDWRYDITGNMGQWLTLGSRTVTGQMDVYRAYAFLRSKLAPIPGLTMDFYANNQKHWYRRDANGDKEPITPPSALWELGMPIGASKVAEQVQKGEPVSEVMKGVVPEFFGIGAAKYRVDQPPRAKSKTSSRPSRPSPPKQPGPPKMPSAPF